MTKGRGGLGIWGRGEAAKKWNGESDIVLMRDTEKKWSVNNQNG